MRKRCMALFLAALLITAAFPSMAAAADTQPDSVSFELKGENIVVDKSGKFIAPHANPPADAEGWSFGSDSKLSADIVVNEELDLEHYLRLAYTPEGGSSSLYSLGDYAGFVKVSLSQEENVLSGHKFDKFLFSANMQGEAKITLEFAGLETEFSVTVKDPKEVDGFNLKSSLIYKISKLGMFYHEPERDLEWVPATLNQLEDDKDSDFRLTVSDCFYNAPYYGYQPDSTRTMDASVTDARPFADAGIQHRMDYMVAAQDAGILPLMMEAPALTELPLIDPVGDDFIPRDDSEGDYIAIWQEANKIGIANAVKNEGLEFKEDGGKEFRIKDTSELEVGPASIVYYHNGDSNKAEGVDLQVKVVDNKIVINNMTGTAEGVYKITIPFWYKGEAYMYHDILKYSELDREIDLKADDIIGQKGIKLVWSDAYWEEAYVSVLLNGSFEDLSWVRNGKIIHAPSTVAPLVELFTEKEIYGFKSTVDMDGQEAAVLNFGKQIVGTLEYIFPEENEENKVAPGSSIEMAMVDIEDEHQNSLVGFEATRMLESVAILTEKTSGKVLRIPVEIYGPEFTLKMPEAEGEYEVTVLVGEPAAAAPTASPAPGNYRTAQSVTLSTATKDASIYYTVDGSEPNLESTKYSSEIKVSKTTTIKAVAVKDGAISAVSRLEYTISTSNGFTGWPTGGNDTKTTPTATTPAITSDAAVSTSPEKASGFADVAADAWYYEAVSFVAEKGIAQGVSGTEFSPQGTVTRGQFMTMLCRAYGIPEMAGDNFADAGNTWYSGYLAAAKQLGISAGVGDNLFAPEQVITREQMMTLLYNYLKSVDPELKAPESAALTYLDAAEISSWAVEGVTYGTAGQWVKGKDGNRFDPQGIATRAELAQIFYNILTADAPAADEAAPATDTAAPAEGTAA